MTTFKKNFNIIYHFYYFISKAVLELIFEEEEEGILILIVRACNVDVTEDVLYVVDSGTYFRA